jgi:undecaprenyl-diphosphatase
MKVKMMVELRRTYCLMNNKTVLPSALISILCALGFACMALLYSSPYMKSFDSSIILSVQGMEAPTMTMIMKFFTFIGAGLPIVIIAVFVLVILYFVLGHRRELILFTTAVIGSSLLNVLLKLLFHRPRPDLHRIIEATGFSFPSGHAMAAFSLYATLIFLLWKNASAGSARVLLLLIGSAFIAAIGLSRIYLGVHYPSDVIAGYLASGFWVFLCIWLYRRYIIK